MKHVKRFLLGMVVIITCPVWITLGVLIGIPYSIGKDMLEEGTRTDEGEEK